MIMDLKGDLANQLIRETVRHLVQEVLVVRRYVNVQTKSNNDSEMTEIS